jgi:hypothetical protein
VLFLFDNEGVKERSFTPPGVSIRVAKALGSRGYDKVRVSLVTWDSSEDSEPCGKVSSECTENANWAMQTGIHTNPDWYPNLTVGSTFEDFRALLASRDEWNCQVIPCPTANETNATNATSDNYTNVSWSYNAAFEYRWTNYKLSSAVVSITPGKATTLFLDGHEVQVKIPAEGDGSIGMLIGDPCTRQSSWCAYADVFQIKDTLQTVLNSMAEHDELDYWMLNGDLFYDQDGSITQEFFEGLSVNASSSVLGMTLGNHDYWQQGGPPGMSSDSFGNGHMQWYAQDAMSSKSDEAKPFDFGADPSKNEIVDISNTFWYYAMGNVAYISFSNAYDWGDSKPYFQEACKWVKDTNPALVVLQGHWNNVDLGAMPNMDTEHVFPKLQTLDGCDKLGSRLKFVEGHYHCNKIIKNNTGFMLGSFGMTNCGGDFGLPILDTRQGTAKLYYFELGKQGHRTEDFDAIIDCFKTRGYSKCIKYAQVWMEEPL